MSIKTTETSVKQWGNGLAIRLAKSEANTSGVTAGSTVRLSADVERIAIEVVSKRPTLDEMLTKFDPERHGGELMAFRPVSVEAMQYYAGIS